MTLDKRLSMPHLFIPDEIKKIRNIRSIASYEINWKKEHSVLEMLKNYKEQTHENDDGDKDNDVDDSLLTSIESQDLVLRCYPQLVEAFETTRSTKAKKRTANSRKKKVATVVEENNIGKKDSAKLHQQETKKKTVEIKNNKKIDKFTSTDDPIPLEDSFEKMLITPKRSKKKNTLVKIRKLKIKNPENTILNTKHRKRGPQFDRVLQIETIHSKLNNTLDRMFSELSPDDFMSGNEDDNESNISDVIEDICSERNFDFDIRSHHHIESTNQFTEENIKDDCLKASTSSIVDEHAENKKEKSDDSDDEFGYIDKVYIPLDQRIKMGRSNEPLKMCNQIEKKSCVDFEDILNETDEKSTYLST